MFTALSYVLSVTTVTSLWLAGNKWRWCWIWSAVNQVLWLIWDVGTGNWGLIPMAIIFMVVAIRNHYQWEKQR